MKNRNYIYVAAIIALALQSCAHSSHTRGSVVLIHDESHGDVCLGSKDVKIGDTLSVFKSVCNSTKKIPARLGGQIVPSCEKVLVGKAKIAAVIDQHYSSVEVESGLKLQEGMIVEK